MAVMIGRRKFISKVAIAAFVVLFLLTIYKIHHFLDKPDYILQYEDGEEKEEELIDLYGVKYKDDKHPKDSDDKELDVPKLCHKRKHFVFIKPMKCATETMNTILRRFALNQNLSVLLPNSDNIYLGWPYQMEKQDYRPSDSLEGPDRYECLMEHSIYNRTIMKPLFPSDTVFVTTIREPWKHFLSTFYYFSVEKIAKVPPEAPIVTYLNELHDYEEYYKSSAAAKNRFCIPDGFSVTKNLLSHCLGMPLGFPPGSRNITTNEHQVHAYLDQIAQDFDLVMVVDYFMESLILFKRMMCWSMEEILYKRANTGTYHYKYSQKEKDIHKNWSRLDYLLFERFNKTLWEKIAKEPPDFFEEVQVFKKLQKQVDQFCFSAESKNVTEKSIVVEKTKFNDAFEITGEGCEHIDGNLQSLRSAYDVNIQARFPSGERQGSKVKRNC